MPQTRPMTDRPCRFITRRSVFFRRTLSFSAVSLAAAFTAGAALSPSAAQAKPVVQYNQHITSGSNGWTNTAEVKLHVRPSALTPYIAKVPMRTRLFVWGKFDGWYRVETSEHAFGWVYYKYLNVADESKIMPLSHAKTVQACERSHDLTMYGPPDVLRQYYAKYKAPGALRGLQLQKASLDSADKTKTGTSAQVLYFNSKTPTTLPAGSLPAISANDIMKARQSHLEAQRQKQQAEQAPDVVTPTSTQDAPAAFLQGATWETGEPSLTTFVTLQQSPALANSDAAPATGAAEEGALDDPLSQSPQLPTAPEVQTLISLKKAPPAPSRGGSPRDRARYNEKMGKSMANQALSYRGMPYIYGASSPKRGFDCSGLIYFLLRQRGYNPPRTASGLAHYGVAIPKSQLQPGDLVFFANTYKRGVSHIGIYIGDNKFVHAANRRAGVKVSSLNEPYYKKKWYGARRVPAKG